MTSTYTRPMPPKPLLSPGLGFARAEELEHFVRREFLSRGGWFWDPEHGHLGGDRPPSIGMLWASSAHVDRGSEKAGTAQLLKRSEPRKWGEARGVVLLHQLFGASLPTFLITLSAPICATLDDRQFFALVDHELCHCMVAKDAYGAPRFNDDTGEPIWAIRPHDWEGFSGSVDRWGAPAAGAEGVVRAGLREPQFSWVRGRDLDLRKACGT